VRPFAFTVSHLVVEQPLIPGALKLLFAVNGASPGPTLEATEGDWVDVALTNGMDEEDTAIAFPGHDLVLSPFAAGVATVSQCALQSGNTMHLGFRAARAGVYLYRGSVNEQNVDGLVGALIVRPRTGAPAAPLPPAGDAEYVLLLGEHYIQNVHNTLASYYLTPASGGVPPVPNALTVNGRLSGDLALEAGSRAGASVLHIVGAQALSTFDVSVDGVALQVFAVDGTALARPFLALRSVAVAAGQRVSVLVDWSTLSLPASATGQGVFLRVQARTDAYLVPNASAYLNPRVRPSLPASPPPPTPAPP
jgi:FtsP/CotA-like multicopper oxidase with cupredoxin domain